MDLSLPPASPSKPPVNNVAMPASPRKRGSTKVLATATRGIEREFMSGYVEFEIDIQHRALEATVKRYDAFDGNMQYIFGFVAFHVRKPTLIKRWNDDMDAYLLAAINWMSPQIAEFERTLDDAGLSHAKVRKPKPFKLGSQTPQSTLFIDLLRKTDRMLMLLDSLWLYRLTDSDHKTKVQGHCLKLLGNILNEGRNLNILARKELDEYNQRVALRNSKANAVSSEPDQTPSQLADQLNAESINADQNLQSTGSAPQDQQ
jgi:hypothetical protein